MKTGKWNLFPGCKVDGNAGAALQVCPNAEKLENSTQAGGRYPAENRGRRAGEERIDASGYYLVPTMEAGAKIGAE
jgi:hypothetical protein